MARMRKQYLSVSHITVKGDTWAVYLLSVPSFNRSCGEENEAVMSVKDKSIYVSEDYIKVDTIRHEIMHAYFSYIPIEVMGASPDQVEEAACEIVGMDGPKICAQANRVLKTFKTRKK